MKLLHSLQRDAANSSAMNFLHSKRVTPENIKKGKMHCSTDNIQFLGLFLIFILLTCITFLSVSAFSI